MGDTNQGEEPCWTLY